MSYCDFLGPFNALWDLFKIRESKFIDSNSNGRLKITSKILTEIPDKHSNRKPPSYVKSWPDFIEYFIKVSEHDENKLNHNFQTTFFSCLPCSINYDFITKSETAISDSRKILKILFPSLSEDRIEEISILEKNGREWKEGLERDLEIEDFFSHTFGNGNISTKDPKWLPERLKYRLRNRLKIKGRAHENRLSERDICSSTVRLKKFF